MQKKVEDVKPGDVILVKRNCTVKVTRIEAQDGSVTKGNRLVGYVEGQIVEITGEFDVGSLVDVEVVKEA